MESAPKNTGWNSNTDVVLSRSHDSPGQWFPDTEYLRVSAIFVVGTSGIPPNLNYKSVSPIHVYTSPLQNNSKSNLSWGEVEYIYIYNFFCVCMYVCMYTTKQSVYGWQYIHFSPGGWRTLVKELMATICVMQSSSNELSTRAKELMAAIPVMQSSSNELSTLVFLP